MIFSILFHPNFWAAVYLYIFIQFIEETMKPTCTVTFWSRAWSPPFGDWAAGQVFKHDNDPKNTAKTTTALLKKLNVKLICGASSNGRWRSASSLTSTSSVMSSWKRTPVATCEALVTSMPKRVKAVLENNGGHTKYWHFGPNLDIFT